MPDEELMIGAPPVEDRLVTLGNWQKPPFNRWSFLHMRELMPSQRIGRGSDPSQDLEYSPDEARVTGAPVTRVDGKESTVGEVLDETWTDAAVVIHRGRVAFERYHRRMPDDTPHLLMSVSKSVVGSVAGILVERGVLDPEDPVEKYVPEVAGAGYGGARVRNLLDMRSGVRFSEEYQNLEAEVRQIERHMGWRPRSEGQPNLGLYGYLATLETETEHGGKFVYRSADTDMLGWVLERAADARMADLISELIWRPMGAERDAEITCDGHGSPVHDGGMSATARDLARFGKLLLDDGQVDGRSVIPADWLRQSRSLDPDIREAFKAGDSEPYLPGGWYRNQFWHVPARSGDVQLCLGIHGQMILVDPHTETVSVKLSTWPDPQNPAYLIDTIRAFTSVGRDLAGLPESVATPGDRGAPSDSGVIKGPKETREENLRERDETGPPA
ncbi:MAG: beta-lactamase family protein [Solirubrobacterales bacterium]|nr:beta-lactamase family protein [Solirubrobacterales bacterium]